MINPVLKAIIFDLNGVFVTSPKLSERYEQELGVPVAKFLPVLKATLAQARQPGAPDIYDLWRPYLQAWGVPLDREQFLHFWFTVEGGNEAMINLARELKAQGVQLFILSNNFRERSLHYQQTFSFFTDLFTKIYYSWQTGFIKPDVRAFQLVLTENNLPPAEVLYVDDSAENIEVAASLGMQTYLFQNVAELRQSLINQNLLASATN